MKAVAVYLQCYKCQIGYQLNGADKDLNLMHGKLPCTRSGCKGRLRRRPALEGGRPISAFELYTAVNGGGLPEEREQCTPLKLKKLLLGGKIQNIELKAAAGTRSFIESITLVGGKQVHFAASTKGATIFKVTEAHRVRG
jgi:hypothetical protein